MAKHKFYDRTEAAGYLGESVHNMDRIHYAGEGPRCIKLGEGPTSARIYRRTALDRWLKLRNVKARAKARAMKRAAAEAEKAAKAEARFRPLDTRWSFWVISNDLDDFARHETRQKDKPRGQVIQTDDGRIEVWVKTWSEVLSECKARLRFVQDHLQANLDRESSLRYLKQTYDKYLSGAAEGGDSEAETDEAIDAEEIGAGRPLLNAPLGKVFRER